jgi:anti-sigma regulatory factor (Ser/Thr protein kinase)
VNRGLDRQDGALELVVPAATSRVREVRVAARRFAEEHGVARPDDVEIAVGEAATNVVVHAYVGVDAGPVVLLGGLDATSVVLTVRDEGTGLAPRRDSRGLGWGLLLIAELADAFEIAAHGGGTQVRMHFVRIPDEPRWA